MDEAKHLIRIKNFFNGQGVFDINLALFPCEKSSNFRVSMKYFFRNFSSNSVGKYLEIGGYSVRLIFNYPELIQFQLKYSHEN